MNAQAEPLSERDVLKLLEIGLDKDPRQQVAWLQQLDITEADRLRLSGLLASTTAAEERFQTGASTGIFAPAVSAGDQISVYQLDELLGQGGMGLVFRAHRTAGDFEQTVAIKFVDLAPTSHKLTSLFDNERRILASLNHPNIAALYDGGMHQNVPYVVMEYVEGASIEQYVAQHDVPFSTLLDLFVQVCAGVHFAHQSLIIHRDLKPSNILVTPAGRPKIVD